MTGHLVAGLMSGTSLDGLDAVVVEITGRQLRLVATHHSPMPAPLGATLLALNQSHGTNELQVAAQASLDLSRWYAGALHELLSRAGIPAGQIRALGCHGQTVRHQPRQGYSVQLVNGAWLAELTGITTVTDFRARDIAAGGQGAPLVPAFHQALFSHSTTRRMVLNLGGIANLTRLFPGQPVVGYDCGPANLLLDGWIQRHQGKPHDQDGAWAAGGSVDAPLLAQLLEHPFFQAMPPKSTGREDFNLEWLGQHRLVATLNPRDVQATLMELTASCIAACVKKEGGAEELYACGGGTFNTALMHRLAASLPGTRVESTEALGLSPSWVEAAAFAWLAEELLEGRHGNLPSVTGARRTVPLGAIYPA
jgi:anhydro-N-acetylmuramic acid kinase